jgi:DUF3102 family protein
MQVPEAELPAVVHEMESLAALASKINHAHRAGEAATRRGLEYFRAAGEMLLKAKEQCGHGEWMTWLKKNIKASQRSANKYMTLAARWCDLEGKLESGSNLTDVLRILAGIDEPRAEEPRAEEPRAEEPRAEEPTIEVRSVVTNPMEGTDSIPLPPMFKSREAFTRRARRRFGVGTGTRRRSSRNR